ncbi:DUF300-domain-containing protein [Pisolithus croceorrhizus]|nr:DUF300-domain-containing protein [Pisolithus croceorrhizus]KAI6120227.1 DUF300-domain-containing protein [Pisolithus croceorrhizus]KAI6169870.1 DUF300-domain-containing protein [Pisolithus thermaeus]
MGFLPDLTHGHGAGSGLPLPVLAFAGASTLVAVVVSGLSIWLQLRNYRKPFLQRMVVRIMLMVPLYGVASLISLFSLEAAFFIDAIRDIYEAFVIYCFFVLLVDYLGGERSLLIMLHGRPPIPAVFPVSLWRNEIDVSDPYTFLFLKRGILQYVQVKPVLAFASLIMKATGTYNEGDFRARSGYLYVSIIYNTSICLALWCLAVFWMCVNADLKPFRPVPKFLCVKGILFFSFWQSVIVSSLVAVGVITRLGPYTDNEHISLGLTDTLICFEMPFFAAAHMYAFSYRDFIHPPTSAPQKEGLPMFVARMRLGYAFRDAFGLRDVVEDTRATLRGRGINYRAFEPSEGGMHVGGARERRIRAGLRYSAGGKRKYWLPEVRNVGDAVGHGEREVAAPLLEEDAEEVVHDSPDMRYEYSATSRLPGDDVDAPDDDEYALRFSDALAGPNGADEMLYEHAKKYVFGDYLYPVVDVSSDEARRAMWEEEARMVRESIYAVSGRDERKLPPRGTNGYGAMQSMPRQATSYAVSEERIVDFEEGDSTSVSGGVRLGWTNARAKDGQVRSSRLSSTVSFGSSPHPPNPSRPSSSATSSQSQPRISSPKAGVGSETHLSPPPVERTSSQKSQSRWFRSKSPRSPLAEDDAVDLIIPTDNHYAPPSRGSNSPHSPALIRVWDQSRERISEIQEPAMPSLETNRRFTVAENESEESLRKGNADIDELDEPEDIVRAQTPPSYARPDAYHFGNSYGEEDNPWA